jgi:hypothetical protein
MITTQRPGVDEYPAAFADYVHRIADDEDVLGALGGQLDQTLVRLEGIAEAKGDYRYAPGKWSIKEMVGHLCDTERVFAYRALHIGRGDTTPLHSFDDQAYAAEGRAGDQSLADLAAEWGDVRRATIALFRHLPAVAWNRRGMVSDRPISVRAIAHVIVGHARHHLQVLEERYTA